MKLSKRLDRCGYILYTLSFAPEQIIDPVVLVPMEPAYRGQPRGLEQSVSTTSMGSHHRVQQVFGLAHPYNLISWERIA